MDYEIVRLDVSRYETFAKDPLASSLHAAVGRQTYVIVRLETRGGTVGYGEAPSVPFITGETTETMLICLRDYLFPALIGQDIRDMGGLHRKMRHVFPHGNTSSFSAIDLAAYDALGKALGVPVSVLLGGAPRGSVATSRAISTGETGEMVAAARRVVDSGFTTIKIKTGSDDEQELAAIRAIREEAGPDLRIKIDANQGWSLSQAMRFLDRAEKYDIMVCEQPLEAGDLPGAAELRRRSSIPIMLDESIHSAEDALRAARMGACDYINIKLLKAGGLYPAAKIATVAAAAGIECQIGSLSTSIGSAAAVQLVHAHPVISLPEIVWPDRLTENPASGFAIQGERVSVPEEPGFGVRINDDIAAELERRA